MTNWITEEKFGVKIHTILNDVLYRKLTLREYKKLVGLIDSVFDLIAKERAEVVETLRKNLLDDPRAEVEGNQVWNAVVNQVLKLTEPKLDYRSRNTP